MWLVWCELAASHLRICHERVGSDWAEDPDMRFVHDAWSANFYTLTLLNALAFIYGCLQSSHDTEHGG